ncbi:MAG: type I 3-dehydroquinate dehydratase [Oscillospiraceae bacterium]|nr:type I 3-dehydroquinate dehydratase [Oscillospiraceae bacterium]
MRTLTIRGVTFGEGRAKIAVPIVGRTRQDVLAEAAALLDLQPDLVEWRADFYDALTEPRALTDTLRALRGVLGELPLLFTVRTAREGGNAALSPADYAALTLAAAQSGCIDLADVELSIGRQAARALIAGIHAASCRAVGSRHDFSATPAQEVMRGFLCEAQELDADVPKLAVMAHSDADTLSLLSAALAFRDHDADRPFVAIAMGAHGVLSRVACGLSGSCLTFGAAERGSAPGQLPVSELRTLLALLPQ